MPEADNQGIMQLRSRRRDQNSDKDRLTPHFILSLARGLSMVKVSALTELWGLRVKVESYSSPKEHTLLAHTSELRLCIQVCDLRGRAPIWGVSPQAAV